MRALLLAALVGLPLQGLLGRLAADGGGNQGESDSDDAQKPAPARREVVLAEVGAQGVKTDVSHRHHEANHRHHEAGHHRHAGHHEVGHRHHEAGHHRPPPEAASIMVRKESAVVDTGRNWPWTSSSEEKGRVWPWTSSLEEKGGPLPPPRRRRAPVQGPPGPEGSIGMDKEGHPVYAPVQGPPGPEGPVGLEGHPGEVGSRGLPGPQGPAGPKGEPGDPGEAAEVELPASLAGRMQLLGAAAVQLAMVAGVYFCCKAKADQLKKAHGTGASEWDDQGGGEWDETWDESWNDEGAKY